MATIFKRILTKLFYIVDPRGFPNYFFQDKPSSQNAVRLFQGGWASRLPVEGIESGSNNLFNDDRIRWFLEKTGSVVGKNVLELGPLEGGHTYMLDRAGAKSVTAIEANGNAWLKCLAVKETLGIPSAKFLLGDFVKHLAESAEQFEACINCGVLYHLHDPHALFPLLQKRCTGPIMLWTMIWSEQIQSAHPILHKAFKGVRTATLSNGKTIQLHRHEYGQNIFTSTFWGGNASYSEWMSREDLIASVEAAGYQIQEIAFDEPNHPNGPALAMILVPSR